MKPCSTFPPSEQRQIIHRIIGEHYKQLSCYAISICYRNSGHQPEELLSILMLKFNDNFETIYKGYQRKNILYLMVIMKNLRFEDYRETTRSRRHESFIRTRLYNDGISMINNRIFEEDKELEIEDILISLGTVVNDIDLEILTLLLEEKSYKEIASELNMKINTVGTRIRRLKQRLVLKWGSVHNARSVLRSNFVGVI